MAKILALATAGIKPGQLADREHLLYPRIDYLELQQHLDVDIINYTAYNQTYFGHLFRTLETQVRSDLYLTFLGMLAQKRHRAVFAMSERAGIPYAALHRYLSLSTPLVSMFTCWSARQEKVITALNLFAHMDSIIVKCESMKQHFLTLGAPPERLHLIRFAVDHRFFAARPDVAQEPGFILSLGEVRSRDYPSLFQAVEGLPLQLLVAASGSWYAREKNSTLSATPPPNVTVSGKFSLSKLRELYAKAQFVVLPIHDVVFSAGATVVLEAMSMGRAVIVTRSAGILDFVIDGETGLIVEPNNPAALRAAIQYLLANPAEARRMGENARLRIEEELNMDVYVARISQLLQEYI